MLNAYSAYKKQSLTTLTPMEIVVKLYDEAERQMNRAIYYIGEKNYEINGRLHETDTAARLVDGNAYIPLRTLAEFLGYHVAFVPLCDL